MHIPNKKTLDNIQIIRNIVEKKIVKGEKLFMVLIDRLRLDRQKNNLEEQKEKKYPRLIRVIKNTYQNSYSKMQLSGKLSNSFKMERDKMTT